jgi:serine/threonine protein kinase
MGVVYVAEHESLGRKVVIKVLSYHLADDKRAQSRFEREARGLSVLDHPNVVTVHDFGLEKGLTYIVMEYVEGENLSQRVRRKGRVPYDELLPIAMQTIDAIAAAHDKGIVHRDVKPSNVMVTTKAGRGDFVKVLDFGLAKLATNSVDITQGNLVGTVSYLSPEVIKGSEALPAADVYALGVMFYYLLSGAKPFQSGDDMSVLYQHVNVEPDWLGDKVPAGEAPQEFLEFIHHCMAKDPAKRPQSAIELRQLLGEMVSLPSISAFSIESSTALPRYSPPDSSGLVKRPRIDTAPSLSRPVEVSQQSMTRPSIAMARPKPMTRIAVIAFTFCSLGLVALAFLVRTDDKPEPEPAPAKPTPALVTTTSPPKAAPDATTARFTLVTTPAAQIALDGEVQGRSPLSLDMEPGSHVVSASEPGYRPWTQSVELAAGDTRQLDVFLEKVNSQAAPKPKPKPVVRRPVRKVTEPVAVAKPDPPPTEVVEPKPEPEPEKPKTETKKPGNGLLTVDDKKGGLLPVAK